MTRFYRSRHPGYKQGVAVGAQLGAAGRGPAFQKHPGRQQRPVRRKGRGRGASGACDTLLADHGTVRRIVACASVGYGPRPTRLYVITETLRSRPDWSRRSRRRRYPPIDDSDAAKGRQRLATLPRILGSGRQARNPDRRSRYVFSIALFAEADSSTIPGRHLLCKSARGTDRQPVLGVGRTQSSIQALPEPVTHSDPKESSCAAHAAGVVLFQIDGVGPSSWSRLPALMSSLFRNFP